jgi:UTP--glucose-1-phosphate uridylyltransferase
MPGSLEQQLDQLAPELRALLDAHRFDRKRFVELAARLSRGDTGDNRVVGNVEPPAPGDVADLPAPGSAEHARLESLGLDALSRGECALCVLAGGMATRMGGVVKALVDALPGHSFLSLRLAEMDAIERRSGVRPPLWLMTSAATDRQIRETLGDRLDGDRLGVFTQELSLRLTPEGKLFVDSEGHASEHAPGHGDLPEALQHSRMLDRFRSSGGRVVMVANLDNLGATLDPVTIGWHLSHGKPVSCEVVDKLGADRGGIPVRWDTRPVVLEEFRLPVDFDAAQVRVFNTNTFTFDAGALADLGLPWTFFRVTKQVEGKPVVQFERLIGEVTSFLETRFVRVPREGAASRFLPVKDHDELSARRSQIEAVVRARGILP